MKTRVVSSDYSMLKHTLPPLFENIESKILQCLSSRKTTLSEATQAHANVIKAGACNDTNFGNKLISLYSTHHSLSDAHLLCTSLPEPNIFSFAPLIYASTKLNQFQVIIGAFCHMITKGIAADAQILPSVIKACAGFSLREVGRQVHWFGTAFGFDSNSLVSSSLVHMYLKYGRLRDARNVFNRMAQPSVVPCSALLLEYARKGLVDETMSLFLKARESGVELNLVSWNGMIAGFNQSANCKEAVAMFRNMHLEGIIPDGISVSSVLPAVGDLELLEFGIQVHAYVVKCCLGQDKCVASALVDMYGKCVQSNEILKVNDDMEEKDVGVFNALIMGLSRNGLIDDALQMFRRMKHKGMNLNVVSWTSMIASCSQNGRDIEALELFREMQSEGVKANAVTIPCLLPACGNVAALAHGRAAHCFSLRTGIFNDFHVGSALIDMYAKCGRIHLSRLCFDMMPRKNSVCWNSLISGYAMHGKSEEATHIFNLMQKNGHKPDFITFTCLLSACSQGGLIKEGQDLFNNMSRDYGIAPTMEHYACMVTLLSRAGRLDEAYSIIKQMPWEPSASVWGTLLSSCKVHNNVDLGEIAARKLFEIEPLNPGNYVLLSNIYASKGMWSEVNKVRDAMRSKGLKKNPGCSWISIKNKVHTILAGDETHPQMAQIIEKLEKLIIQMKNSGLIPKTDYVLQDVDEQDKEQILCGHSEKLALALGLISTSAGSPIQVIKNLRICGDCHAFFKFTSSFERRDIFVRDTNRFHHFKDGTCSCKDYW